MDDMPERFYEPSHVAPEADSELTRLKEQDRFERAAKAFLESVESGKVNLADPTAVRYRELLQRLKTRLEDPGLIKDKALELVAMRVSRIAYDLKRQEEHRAEAARQRAEVEAFARVEDPLKSLKDRLRRK